MKCKLRRTASNFSFVALRFNFNFNFLFQIKRKEMESIKNVQGVTPQNSKILELVNNSIESISLIATGT